MANIIKNYPSPVNIDLLMKQLTDAGYTSKSRRLTHVEIHNVTDDQSTNDAIDAIIAAHVSTDLTDEQQVEAAALVALGQGKVYLRNQLIKASPNVNDVYTTVKNAVDGNPYLLQMVTNVIAINSNAYVWTLNLVTPTALDKQRYIKCVMEVIALLT